MEITPQELAAVLQPQSLPQRGDMPAELGISVERVKAAAARIFVALDCDRKPANVTEDVAYEMYSPNGRLYG